ncbi:MAG: SAM-dependent chlorinase/fluorinase [Chloroflexi bacterium]|nr:SAM-dependent chlorinase/fluorinase [Chloroflexota bacterium]
MPVVTLTTDFGLADGYVAAMKGVILSLAPQATLVDVSHLVPPQDVLGTALLLEGVTPFFAPDTVHLVVVDPGVGTQRRPLAAQTSQGLFVAPDNGVLTTALAAPGPQQVVHLTNPTVWRRPVSATFHGRDIFAPAAAHLALGWPLERLGQPIADPHRLSLPQPTCRAPGEVWAEVIHVDRFGNLVTSLRAVDLPGPPQGWRFQVGAATVAGLRCTYAEAPPGDLLALTGSGGRVEIAQRDGHAAQTLGLGRGAPVVARCAETTDHT